MRAVYKSVADNGVLAAESLRKYFIERISSAVAVTVACCAFKAAFTDTVVDKCFEHLLAVVLRYLIGLRKYSCALRLRLLCKRKYSFIYSKQVFSHLFSSFDL